MIPSGNLAFYRLVNALGLEEQLTGSVKTGKILAFGACGPKLDSQKLHHKCFRKSLLILVTGVRETLCCLDFG